MSYMRSRKGVFLWTVGRFLVIAAMAFLFVIATAACGSSGGGGGGGGGDSYGGNGNYPPGYGPGSYHVLEVPRQRQPHHDTLYIVGAITGGMAFIYTIRRMQHD